MSGFHGHDESRGTSAGGNPPATYAVLEQPERPERRRVAVVIGKARDLTTRWKTLARQRYAESLAQ